MYHNANMKTTSHLHCSCDDCMKSFRLQLFYAKGRNVTIEAAPSREGAVFTNELKLVGKLLSEKTPRRRGRV